MGNRIFVGNIAYSLSDEDLKEAFANCGTVTDAKVMIDKETGHSRGFGFVTFSSDAEAQKAIETWNGENLGGRHLVVNEAHARPGNRSGGGGFRGNGGGSEGGGRWSRSNGGGRWRGRDHDDRRRGRYRDFE